VPSRKSLTVLFSNFQLFVLLLMLPVTVATVESILLLSVLILTDLLSSGDISWDIIIRSEILKYLCMRMAYVIGIL